MLRFSVWMVILFCAARLSVAQDMPLSQVLVDNEGWRLVSSGHKFTEGPASDAKGVVYFTDIPNSRIHKVALDGTVSVFVENSAGTNGLMFGPDGLLYGCRNGEKKIVAYKSTGEFDTIASDVNSNDLVVDRDGRIFFTDPPGKRVWYIGPQREKRVVAEGISPNGLILWRDGKTLVVTEGTEQYLWTFRVEPDGSLTAKDKYYGPLQTAPQVFKMFEPIPVVPNLPHLHPARAGSDGMTIDRDGRVYVATRMGVQVFDPTGRPCGSILTPTGTKPSNVCFGGPGLDELFATCGDRVFRRKTKVRGFLYFEPPAAASK